MFIRGVAAAQVDSLRNANQQCLFFSTATLTLWSPVAVGIVGAKIEAGPGLCCGDRAVPRAIETIPNSFANLRGHVRIRRSRATCARRRALCRPAVRRLRSTEPCAQTPHRREIRECKLWIGRLGKDEDRSQFVRALYPRQLPAPRSSSPSRPASKLPGQLQRLRVPLAPCARAASRSLRK